MKILKIFLLFILVISYNVKAYDRYQADKPYFILIPGAGASGGKLYVKNLTKLLKVSGHGEYFSEYYKLMAKLEIPFTICPQIEDKDKRLLTVRANECSEIIKRLVSGNTPRRNIVLVGHSMGGNIARLVADDKKVSNYIHSVLTLSSPNKGTVLSDFVYEQYKEGYQCNFYRWVIEFIGFTPENKEYIKELEVARSYPDQSVYRAMDVEQNPNVQYFSFSNSVKRSALLPLEFVRSVLSKEIVKRGYDNTEYKDRNDGIVPEYSMPYGNYLGHIEADHWEVLCIGILKFSKGCKKTMDKIIPFFNKVRDQVQQDLN